MARHFDKAGPDYIEMGTGVRGSDVQKITAGAWVKLDDIPGAGVTYCILSRWNNSTSESYTLYVTEAAKLKVTILGSDLNGYSATGATTLSAGVWYHLAFSYDSTTLAVYVNGVSDGTATPGHSMSTGTLNFLVGKQLDGAPMNGAIAEVTVWLDVDNVAAIVAALAVGASPSDLEGLSGHDHIGYWPLLGESSEPDYTPNDHAGTVHGTTVVDHPPVRSITAFKPQ